MTDVIERSKSIVRMVHRTYPDQPRPYDWEFPRFYITSWEFTGLLWVDFHLSYFDNGEPVRVEVSRLSNVKIVIVIYLNREYDVMVHGEPIDPYTYYHSGKDIFISRLILDEVKDGVVKVSFSDLLHLLLLYLLERRYNAVTRVIEELERMKQEETRMAYRADYDTTARFLKWLRDTVFPLIDHAIDLSYIKTIEDMLYRMKAKDVYMTASLLEFLVYTTNLDIRE